MTKEMKKILALTIVGLFMFSLFAGVVSAQGFWERWRTGIMDDLDAKIILFILVAVIMIAILNVIGLNIWFSILFGAIISFLLSWVVSPAALLGIFSGYEPVTLTIATFIPLLIFFALTYISVARGKRTLMAIQVFAWLIFFIYSFARLILLGIYYVGFVEVLRAIPGASLFLNLTLLPEAVTLNWAILSAVITTIIAGMMTFKNGWVLNKLMAMTLGVKDITAEQEIKKIKTGFQLAREVGEEVRGGGESR